MVSDRSVTVSFSSDKLVRGSSQLTVVAYKPQGNDATPTKGVFNTLDVIKLKNYLANVEDVKNLWTDRDEYVADYNKDLVVNLLDVAAMKVAIANRVLSE